MSTGLPSDEVAEDYKGALEDLVTNDRYSISNLTMIAKENIEHAEAISRVLTNHINRAPPTRKLPALYVLDSLAKNIGSPYTVYFARNIHQTFMLAYTQVDGAIRRKLEEMLRTWREPVPGSLSTAPVFPISSTQNIVDTLNQYRASTAQNGQRYQPSHAPGVRPHVAQQPYRSTPTPPQTQLPMHTHYGMGTPQPSTPQFSSQVSQPHAQAYTHPSAVQYQESHPQQQQSFNAPAVRSSVDLVKLNADIDDLTTDAKIECATHPMDNNAQRKLTTLQTLKELLDSGPASEQDLIDIQTTITQEMAKKLASKPQPVPVPPAPTPQNHTSYMQPQSQYYAPPPALAPSFLNSTNLADLLRATANPQSNFQTQSPFPAGYPPPPPPPTYGTPTLMHAAPIPIPAPSQAAMPQMPPTALPLLEQLRASGLLSATPTPPQGPISSTMMTVSSNNAGTDIKLTSAWIKVPHPHLTTSFLDDKPNQCSTCGRRFASDDVGKEKKARHLDWHFKTKARMIEAEKRGQNRSWYIDEREWIANKELDDDAAILDENGGMAPGSSPSSTAKKQQAYVVAPTDPALRNAPCPIDQEPFRSEWSEEVQDFIWKDAIRVGNRYYHASCYKEATKDRDRDGAAGVSGTATARTATPDSVLGKRKAEQGIDTSAKSKIKLEA